MTSVMNSRWISLQVSGISPPELAADSVDEPQRSAAARFAVAGDPAVPVGAGCAQQLR
jgi:hypothetical protein